MVTAIGPVSNTGGRRRLRVPWIGQSLAPCSREVCRQAGTIKCDVVTGETVMRRKVLGFSAHIGAAARIAPVLLPVLTGSALALDEGKDEKENLRACERRVCDIFLKKSLKGDDLKCGLVKTWAKSSIKSGVETGKISWTSGDARCEMELNLSRPELVAAMTAPGHRFNFPEHTIKCAIEEDKHVRNIRVVLAPEVEFKAGVATSGKVHVKKVDAPFLMKTGIWTAATMIDKFGLFEKKLMAELNKLVQKRCPEQYGKQEEVAKKPAPVKSVAKKTEGAKPAEGEKKEAQAEPQKAAAKPEAKGGARAETRKTETVPSAKSEASHDAAVAAPAAKPDTSSERDAKKAE